MIEVQCPTCDHEFEVDSDEVLVDLLDGLIIPMRDGDIEKIMDTLSKAIYKHVGRIVYFEPNEKHSHKI